MLNRNIDKDENGDEYDGQLPYKEDVYHHYLNIRNAVDSGDSVNFDPGEVQNTSQDFLSEQIEHSCSSLGCGIAMMPQANVPPINRIDAISQFNILSHASSSETPTDFDSNSFDPAEDAYEEDIDVVNTTMLERARESSATNTLISGNKRILEIPNFRSSKPKQPYFAHSCSLKRKARRSSDLSCPKCGKIFSSKRNLKRHMRTMDSKYFGICRSGKGRVTTEEELEIIAVHALQMLSGHFEAELPE